MRELMNVSVVENCVGADVATNKTCEFGLVQNQITSCFTTLLQRGLSQILATAMLQLCRLTFYVYLGPSNLINLCSAHLIYALRPLPTLALPLYKIACIPP